MMLVMGILTVNYCFITPEIIKVFLPSTYWDGADMMPAIVFGYFFSFLFSIYVNIVYINNNRDVYSRTVFLPVPMSYGGSVCAASCYNIAISKEKRRYMFKRMQIMCKELSS